MRLLHRRRPDLLLFCASFLCLPALGCKDRLARLSPSISVTPNVLDFGSLRAGTSKQLTVAVSNLGTAPLDLSAVKIASDPSHELALSAVLDTDCAGQPRTQGSLYVTDCARFTVTWAPLDAHTAAGAIELDSNDEEYGVLLLPLKGEAVAPALQVCVLKADGSVDPAACSNRDATPPGAPTVDFGAGHISVAAVKTVRLTNVGGAPLDFSAAPALSALTPPDFALAGTILLNTLAPGAHADLTVTAKPLSTGTITGALALASNDKHAPKVSVPLTVTVASFPIIKVAPAALAFGSTEIGTPQQLRVSVSNVGTAPLDVSAIKVSGDPNHELEVDDLLLTDCSDHPRTGGLVVAPGECARFTAVWTPLATHLASGEIEVDSSDAATPAVRLPVSGTAVTPLLQVCVLTAAGAVEPARCSNLGATPHLVPALDFGTGFQGVAQSRVVRLTNQGTAPLRFSPQPVLSATTPADFTLAGAVYGGALAPNATADLTVTVKPSAAGNFTGALNLASDDLRAPTLSIPLSVSVAGYQLCVSPAAGLAFGTVAVGSTASQTLTLTNCGATPFTVTTFSLAPGAPTTTQFTLPAGSSPAIGSTLAVGAAITLPFTYKPTAAQSDKETLTYAFTLVGAPTQVKGTATLTGTGNAVQAACGTTSRPNPVINTVASYSTDQSGSGTYTVFNPATTPSPVIPLDWVKLNASGSTVAAAPASYTWQLTSQPAGSSTSLSSTSAAQVTMWTLVAGTYVVTLTVTDASGCGSSSTLTLQVVPQAAIHIEMFWPDGCGDDDLHYVAPGGAICDGNDLYYRNSVANHGQSPDWGCSNTSCNGAPSRPGGARPDHTSSDDATLDHDNTTGASAAGPENVSQNQPFDSPAGTPYQVWVYYYSNHGSCGVTHPSVTVYVNGIAKLTTRLTAGFTSLQRWHAANIAVANGGTQITVTASDTTAQSGGACTSE